MVPEAAAAVVVPPAHTQGTHEVHRCVSFTRANQSERAMSQHTGKQLLWVIARLVLLVSMVGVAVLIAWLIHGVVRLRDVVGFLVLPLALLAFYYFVKENRRPMWSNHKTEP